LHELSPISCTGEPLETVVSAERDPEQQLRDKETREGLEAAVRALPESYRAVLLLRRFEELSTTEAAALLEISEGCAKTRPGAAAQPPSGCAGAIWLSECDSRRLAGRNGSSG